MVDRCLDSTVARMKGADSKDRTYCGMIITFDLSMLIIISIQYLPEDESTVESINHRPSYSTYLLSYPSTARAREHQQQDEG